MNLILFTELELREGVSTGDPRAQHILRVLGRAEGEPFDIGIINGPRGKAKIRSGLDRSRLGFDYELLADPPALYPVVLAVGFSRPQTMRRLLRDCTSLGVCQFRFFPTDRGERGYTESALWKSGEYHRYLLDGAQQAFSTRIPEVGFCPSMEECLSASGPRHTRAALDNYESERSLGAHLREPGSCRPSGGVGRPSTLAPIEIIVGSERGWSQAERSSLRSHGVSLVHLGDRVLRTDVACLSALSIVLSELGFYEHHD